MSLKLIKAMVNTMVNTTSWECYGCGEIGCSLFIWNEQGEMETIGSLKGDNGNSWFNKEPWSESINDKPNDWFIETYWRLREIYSLKSLYSYVR